MKLIRNWILPLVIALVLVFVFRCFLFDFISVTDKRMENTLKKGDIVLIGKVSKIRHSSVVLFNNRTAINRLARCTGLPGDTLQIKNSFVFINNKKQDFKYSGRKKISTSYVFHTDSTNVQAIFKANGILFNQKLAEFSVYYFYSDQKKLQALGKQAVWSKKRMPVCPKGLYSDKTAPFNTHFYWNMDNIGPLVIPAAGKSIKLNNTSFALYKSIILQETGKNYKLAKNKVYLDNKKVKIYTFKYDYYFVLNDNRTNFNDSRSFGFISRNQILGKFMLKLF